MKKFLLGFLLLGLLTVTSCSQKQNTPSPNNEAIENIAVNLVTDMSKGEFNKAANEYSYTAEMKKVISAQFLQEQIWEPLTNAYGAFQAITGTTASQAQGYDIISVKTNFAKAKLNLNIVFDENKVIAGINYTPDQEAISENIPSGVKETEIKFGKKEWELPGTLTTPEKTGKYPVVILVHGSGPNDRDETILATKPFRDLAWGLAQKGIATLRYDKRTFVYQKKLATADPEDFTVEEEVIEDVLLAVDYATTLKQVDPQNIFVLGHSLGGTLIPRIAKKTDKAVGFIIMAGAVTPLEDLIVEQIKYISSLDGLSANDKQTIATYEKMRTNVKQLTPNSQTKPADLFGTPAAYWLDLKNYQPAKVARNIKKPLLLLQGERDYQVPPRELQLWKNELANKKNVQFISYPNLNHLFVKGEGKSTPQEYSLVGYVEKKVIEDIANWIKQNHNPS
ncbi:MAG: alpha/beta fold hydrolase [Clostridia bacterium]|nr:alpha/beta fold hydrolase [Clostridia bacterium]